MESKTRWPWWAALALAVPGLAWYGYSQLGNLAPARLVADPTSYDFGEVSAPVEVALLLQNAGGQPLEILGVSTSCGCTRAWVEREALPPGAVTPLHISFDPTVHEGLTGPVVRQVYVRSNDPAQPELTLELHATVVASEGGP